jgi:hypothetical protein
MRAECRTELIEELLASIFFALPPKPNGLEN